MTTIPILEELNAALPEGRVITEPATMDAYRWDRANDPDAGVPLAVVRAETTEEVQAVVSARTTARGTPASGSLALSQR